METRAGRAWIINAFIFFLPVLFLWIVAALWVNSSLGVQFTLFSTLQTSLFADYGPDYFNQSFKSLTLSIFGDVFSDPEQSGDVLTGLEIILQGPVPTATPGVSVFQPTLTPQFVIIIEPTPTIIPPTAELPKNTPTKLPENTQTPMQPPTATAIKFIPSVIPERIKITPLLKCITDNGTGTYTAYFGYNNPNSFDVAIPVGDNNQFLPDPKDRSQSVKFAPGKVEVGFQVEFSGEPITWHLDGGEAIASVNSKLCSSIPSEEIIDTTPPEISEGDPNPPVGDYDVCSMTITVNNLRIVDPPLSSGIAWVKLKYNVEGYTDYIYSNPMALCSGGFTEAGGWNGCYAGSILVSIDPNWTSPDPEPFIINLYAKAKDNNGNCSYAYLGQYKMPASCGKPK